MNPRTEPLLVPAPQRCERHGTGAPLSTPVEVRHDPALPDQGFIIDITTTAVRLRHADAAGLRYGTALLDQVRSQSVTDWPALHIADWPDFPTRGYLLDISRGRVPTRDTLDRIVALLELLRINQFQLYTEHTFAYRDHEAVWRDASPMTPDDIRWLDDRCAAAGIELVANQNTFGHMENWFSAGEEYLARAEKPDGFEIFGSHRAPMTLEPTADNAAFALGLLDELLPHFRSDQVNIGCDETWELGRGRSAAAAERHGTGRLYLDYLKSIVEPLVDRGRRPQFWGDIVAAHPDLVAELPAGATAVAWDYEAPWPAEAIDAAVAAFGDRFTGGGLDLVSKLDGFASTVAPFRAAGYPFWVAPGTGTWTSLIGRLETAYGNLLDTARVGLDAGATGYLVTDWGDRGHLQPPSVSFPPLVYGAAVSWAQTTNHDLDVTAVLDRFVFADPTGRLGAALDLLGRAHTRTGQLAFNASPLQLALLPEPGLVIGEPDRDRLDALLSDLDRAMTDIASADPNCVDGEAVKQELVAATRLARHGGRRLLRAAGDSAVDDAALRADLAESIALHDNAWALRSRPGGRHRGRAALEELSASYES